MEDTIYLGLVFITRVGWIYFYLLSLLIEQGLYRVVEIRHSFQSYLDSVSPPLEIESEVRYRKTHDFLHLA